MPILLPAILTRDVDEYYEKLRFLEQIPEISELHIDFEDGVFVRNDTFLPAALAARDSRLAAEAHLMVANPQKYFHALEHAGVKTIHLHFESFARQNDLTTAISNAKHLGFRVGVVINPETDISVFDGIADLIDIAMLMSVHPGFQGAKFVPESLDRLHALRKQYPKMQVQIDGGIKLDNIASVRAFGADRIVVGSGVWQNKDVKQAINELLNKIK